MALTHDTLHYLAQASTVRPTTRTLHHLAWFAHCTTPLPLTFRMNAGAPHSNQLDNYVSDLQRAGRIHVTRAPNLSHDHTVLILAPSPAPSLAIAHLAHRLRPFSPADLEIGATLTYLAAGAPTPPTDIELTQATHRLKPGTYPSRISTVYNNLVAAGFLTTPAPPPDTRRRAHPKSPPTEVSNDCPVH